MSNDPYRAVSHLLDELRGAEIVPPGAPGRAGAAVDALRDLRAPEPARATAEALSTTLLRWHWATRQPAGAADFAAAIERLREAWLELPLPEAAQAA